jgi:hypothetical protein
MNTRVVKDEPLEEGFLVWETSRKSGKKRRLVEVVVPTIKELERRRRADAMRKKEEDQDQNLGDGLLNVGSFIDLTDFQ